MCIYVLDIYFVKSLPFFSLLAGRFCDKMEIVEKGNEAGSSKSEKCDVVC